MYLPAIRKAATAGAVAALGALGVALADGSLTTPEILVAIGTGLTAAAGTYRVPNEIPKPPKGVDPDEADVDLLPDLPHAG